MDNVKKLEEITGYTFRDPRLARTALTHPSYANDHNCESYQRLEYLGDAILDFVIAEKLFTLFPNADEGVLTKKRIAAVSETPLKTKAEELGFRQLIFVKQHAMTDSVLADVFEAVIAAIYLDGGMQEARSFILAHLTDLLQAKPGARDYKSRLNEALPHSRVVYRLLSVNGPAHDPLFEISLEIDGEEICQASAKSKKLAEQKCAGIALKKINA